jgi:thiamine biosynthesis lipoprotein
VSTAEAVRRVEHVMGMPISLALRGRYAGTAEGEAAWHAALDVLHEVDAVFSTYRPDSWISRLGRGEVPIKECPPEVAEVLAIAERTRVDSAGAFDVWRVGTGHAGALDPSGVVKGWAVERASAAFDHLEETDVCLSAGGDLTCTTRMPGSPGWRIGIEDPFDAQGIIAVVPVRDCAVATSGLAHREAHIVDPRTGAVPIAWASVTVLDASLTWADVDATAAFALGETAEEWLVRRGRRGVLVDVDGQVRRFGAWDAGRDTVGPQGIEP